MSNKIIHKHSSVVTDGNPKIPTSSQLDYGELAINYADGVETISFKNSNNEIVEIKTKNYFDNQIDSNSEKIQALEDSYDLIVSEIENNELVTATAITNLEERTTNVENGLTEKSDVGHTHTSANISDSISAKSGVTSAATGLVQGKAVYDYAPPKSHASSSTTYGVATTANYGHVKISNGDVKAAGVIANGIAAGMTHTHSDYSVSIDTLKSDVLSLKEITPSFIYLSDTTLRKDRYTQLYTDLNIPSKSIVTFKLTFVNQKSTDTTTSIYVVVTDNYANNICSGAGCIPPFTVSSHYGATTIEFSHYFSMETTITITGISSSDYCSLSTNLPLGTDTSAFPYASLITITSLIS